MARKRMGGPRKGEVVIDDSNFRLYQDDQVVDGVVRSRGCIPRNYDTHPQGCYASASAFDLPLIDQSEWSARIKELVEQKALLSDIRMRGNNGQMIDALDQDRYGYCWMHSGTGSVIMIRAINNQPYASLSAFAAACIIKGYRNEGGWGAEGVDFLTSRGVPTDKFWAQRSVDPKNDNSATWENAALHKVTAGWADMAQPQYDRKLTFNQMMSVLLTVNPVVGDFNWWGHSVCIIDPVEVEPGSFGIRILNSWGNGWSDHGMGILRGTQAHPDSAVAPRVVRASAA